MAALARRVAIATLVLIIALFAAGVAQAGGNSWGKVIAEIDSNLQKAVAAYSSSDVTKAKEMVNEAYFGPFESGGMETAVRMNISSKRAFLLEYEFTKLKKLMDSGASVADVKVAVSGLMKMLREDAAKLGGTESSPATAFVYSFMIIVREGFEAILVIGAIVAYLLRSGNAARVRTVYGSAGAAILASAVTAVALKFVFNVSGAGQELLEGITMLLAVVVLFSVSYWLLSKAESKRWKEYIEGKVQSSVSRGNTWALWSAAFLAVYREGAETVLFYQALISDQGTGALGMIGLGFAAGAVALAILYVAIRYGSARIPLKPFFLITSLLLYYLAFVFAGEGIKELQEAGVIGASPVPGVPMVSFLGIYPTVQSLLLQGLLLVAALIGIVYQRFGESRKASGAA